MATRHLKRQAAPVTWPIERKGTKFIARPNPGKSYRLSVPLVIVFKEMLGYCKTTKEVKNIIMDKEVIVDGKRRKDVRYPVGVMDVLSLPVSGEHFRMVLNQIGKLALVKISKEEAEIKPAKVIKITLLKKGKVQLNLSDGRNMTVDKGAFKINDCVMLKGNAIKEHIKFDKKAYGLLLGGKHLGSHGVIDDIKGDTVELVTSGGQKVLAGKKHVFVIGLEKPAIKLSD